MDQLIPDLQICSYLQWSCQKEPDEPPLYWASMRVGSARTAVLHEDSFAVFYSTIGANKTPIAAVLCLKDRGAIQSPPKPCHLLALALWTPIPSSWLFVPSLSPISGVDFAITVKNKRISRWLSSWLLVVYGFFCYFNTRVVNATLTVFTPCQAFCVLSVSFNYEKTVVTMSLDFRARKHWF